MIKMRGLIEIKLGAAGGPAHNVDPYPGANRFLNLVHKPETLFRSNICPYIIGVDFKGYLLELADWRSNLADGEDVSRSKRVYFLVYAGQKT
jgi:hypothetical protein